MSLPSLYLKASMLYALHHRTLGISFKIETAKFLSHFLDSNKYQQYELVFRKSASPTIRTILLFLPNIQFSQPRMFLL
jgi:hypothetical protein